MNKRHEERYEVFGEAEVFVGSSEKGSSLLRGRILDLSIAGCYIQTMAQIAVRRGVPVFLEFRVHGQFFRMRASSPFARTKVGAGFTFIDMDASTRERLCLVLEEIRSRQVRGVDGLVVEPRRSA